MTDYTDFTTIREALMSEPVWLILCGVVIGIALNQYFGLFGSHRVRRRRSWMNQLSNMRIEPNGKVDNFLCKLIVEGIPFLYYFATAIFPLMFVYSISKRFGWWGVTIYISLAIPILYLAKAIVQPIYDDFAKSKIEIEAKEESA